MEFIHTIGRAIFGLYFAYKGLKHFTEVKGMVKYAASKKVPFPNLAVLVTGLMLLGGGLGILFNIYVQESVVALSVFLLFVSIMMHDFWNNPEEKSDFIGNMALLGAVMTMF